MSLLIKIIGTALIYFLSAKAVAPLSLVESESVFAIWPPTGVALSALFIWGSRIWPGIFLGAFTLNLTLTPVLPSLQIAVTNTLGPLVAYWLIKKFSDQKLFESTRAMVLFIVAVILASVITATGGAIALLFHGFIPIIDLYTVWYNWLLGDLIGFLLLVPITIAFLMEKTAYRPLISLEGSAMLGTLLLTGLVVFGPLAPFSMARFPMEYLLLPPLIWGALRFGPAIAAVTLLLVALITIFGSIKGYGPFLSNTAHDTLILLQSFNGVLAVTILLMAATFREKEKALEEKLESRQEALIQQSKMAMMGEMIGAIAHQWRQPINVIGLIIQDMKEAYEFGELTQEYMNEIIRKSNDQIHYMSQTIEDFRNFAKPSRQTLAFAPSGCINTVLSLLKAQLNNNNITVQLELNTKEKVLGNPNELQQVLINLINNAKDAILERKQREGQAAPAGKITLTLDQQEESLIIQVGDNGGGILPSMTETLFTPYVTSKEEKGTGIGLSMSQLIIEKKMGGKLTAQNIQDGALFTISLPLWRG